MNICPGFQVIENSGYGADKFTMVRNNDGTGSLKIVQSLDYEDQLQSNGFRFRIQVNDKVSNEEIKRTYYILEKKSRENLDIKNLSIV